MISQQQNDTGAPRRESYSALRLLAVLCLAAFVAEAAIMLALPYVGMHEHDPVGALVDAAMLTVLLFPVLYLFVVRRLVRQNAELAHAERELLAARDEMEQRVAARTRSLDHSLASIERRHREIAEVARMSHALQGCNSLGEARAIAAERLPRLFPDVSGRLQMTVAGGAMETWSSWGGHAGACADPAPQRCGAMRCGLTHAAGWAPGLPGCAEMRTGDADWSMCLPLVAHGETLGILSLEGGAGARRWLAVDAAGDGGRLIFCEGVAESLALACANIRLREELQFQALRDPLSGLFNRRYLLSAFEREFWSAKTSRRPISLGLFDIDHFKRFNDTWGHNAGDVLIAALGRFLQEEIGAAGIVARYGGEEFVVLLPETPLEIAALRMESLRAAVHGLAVHHDGRELDRVTISVGVAAYPYHGTELEVLLKAADQAMYRAKRLGRDRVSLAPLTREHAAATAQDAAPPGDAEQVWRLAAAG